MAVHCEFIDIIIPIANINRVYPGGFATYKAEHKEEFKGRMYHDDFLFRDGAMNQQDAKDIVDEWTKRGLIPLTVIDGVEHWHELCSTNMLTGLTRPCTWAVYDREQNCVHLRGQLATPVISNR